MRMQPFTVDISQQTLDDLHERLGRTRWPDEVQNAGWDYGTNLTYLKELVDYWHNTFSWRAQEAAINQSAHFRTSIDGLGIHFIHERGKGLNPMPLLILHGWSRTFYQMLKIIPILTDPASYGGDPADSFDVIVSSLPGYGFSDRPKERGMVLSIIADFRHKLMIVELGYERYAIRSSDLGAGITQ